MWEHGGMIGKKCAWAGSFQSVQVNMLKNYPFRIILFG